MKEHKKLDYSTTQHVCQCSTIRRITTDEPAFDSHEEGQSPVLLLPLNAERCAEGGLRLKGYGKQASPSRPLISVITVVYNMAAELEQTIQSVIHQDYDYVEYIVIDGGSTDGAVDILRHYEHAIDYWVSEPDNGIYAAMNKGVLLATGQWIHFKNAGDPFASLEVLTNMFAKETYSSVDIIYGDYRRVCKQHEGCVVYKARPLDHYWKGCTFSHQASFINASYHKRHLYREDLRISGDFAFFYQAWSTPEIIFHYEPVVVANMLAKGLSERDYLAAMLENYSVINATPFMHCYYINLLTKTGLRRGLEYLLGINVNSDTASMIILKKGLKWIYRLFLPVVAVLWFFLINAK